MIFTKDRRYVEKFQKCASPKMDQTSTQKLAHSHTKVLKGAFNNYVDKKRGDGVKIWST